MANKDLGIVNSVDFNDIVSGNDKPEQKASWGDVLSASDELYSVWNQAGQLGREHGLTEDQPKEDKKEVIEYVFGDEFKKFMSTTDAEGKSVPIELPIGMIEEIANRADSKAHARHLATRVFEVSQHEDVIKRGSTASQITNRILVELPGVVAGGGIGGAAIKGVAVATKANSAVKLANAYKTAKGGAIVGGATGLTEAMILKAVDDKVNVRDFDAGDYAQDAFIGGAFGAGVGWVFGKMAQGTEAVSKKVDPETGDMVIEHNSGKITPTPVADSADLDKAMENGFKHVAFTSGVDIKVKDYTDAIGRQLKSLDDEVRVVDRDISDLKARSASEKEFISAKKEEIDVRFKTERDAAKRTKLSDEKFLKDTDKVKSAGVARTGEVKALEKFIKQTTDRVFKETGVDFSKSSKVKDAKESLAGITGRTKLLEEFRQISAAKRLVDDSKSADLVANVEKKINKQLKEEAADAIKTKRDIDNRISKLEKQAEKIQTKRKDFEEATSTARNLDPEDVVDISPLRYQHIKNKLADEEVPATLFHPKAIAEAREHAELIGDSDFVSRVNSLKTSDGVDVGDLDIEELKDFGRVIDSNTERADIPVGKLFDAAGVVASKFKDDFLRGFLGKLLRNTLGNKDGSVSQLAASDYMDVFMQRYNTQSQQIFKNEFTKYAKRRNAGGFSDTRLAFGTDDFRVFSTKVFDYSSARDLGDDVAALAKEFEPEVVAAGDRLATMMASLRKDLVRNHPNLKGEELQEALKDLEKGFMSRSRNDENYKALRNAVDIDEQIAIHEGAIVKGTPWINHQIELGRLTRIATKTQSETARIKELEEIIEDLKDRRNNFEISDSEVDQIINDFKDTRYSNMVAKAFYENQFNRSVDNVPQQKGGLNDDDVIAVLDRAGVMDSIDESARDVIRLFVQNNKELTKGASDPFKSRMPMDVSYARQVTIRGTNEIDTLKMKDYYVQEADKVIAHTIQKYSGLISLRKVGIESFEKFDSLLEEARRSAANLPSNQQRKANAIIDQAEKNFKAQAQFDQTSVHGQLARIAKSMMAATKLGYLPMGILTESWSLAANNGFRSAMKSIPEARRIYNAIRKGELDDEGLSTLAQMGGVTLDPLRNHIARTDSGVVSLTSKSKIFEKVGKSSTMSFLDKSEDFANNYAKATAIMYEGLDVTSRLMNTNLVTQRLLNASPDTLRSPRYRDAGITDEMIEGIEKVNKAGFIKRDSKGKITEIDYKRLYDQDPDLADDLMGSIIRLSDKAIQTVRHSDMPPWYNTEWFSYFGQFRTFMIGAYNNQLIYNINKMDKVTASLFTGQMTISALMYAARVKLEHGDDEKKIEELLDPVKVGLAAFRGTGFGALASSMVDVVGGTLLGVQPFQAGSKTGQSFQLQSFDNTTVVRFYKDALKAFGSVSETVLTGDALSQGEVKTILGLVVPNSISSPLSKWSSEALDLPEKDKRNLFQELVSQ